MKGTRHAERIACPMLSKELLEELKLILKEEYGINLTDDETTKVGMNLVGYFSLLAKIQNLIQSNETNQP